MKKIVAVICFLAFVLTACASVLYDTDDFIGKTSSEIIMEFGEFDCVGIDEVDGLYRNTKCGYTIKEEREGLLSKTEEVLFFIHFDENGIAYECSEGYRPGG